MWGGLDRSSFSVLIFLCNIARIIVLPVLVVVCVCVTRLLESLHLVVMRRSATTLPSWHTCSGN